MKIEEYLLEEILEKKETIKQLEDELADVSIEVLHVKERNAKLKEHVEKIEGVLRILKKYNKSDSKCVDFEYIFKEFHADDYNVLIDYFGEKLPDADLD